MEKLDPQSTKSALEISSDEVPKKRKRQKVFKEMQGVASEEPRPPRNGGETDSVAMKPKKKKARAAVVEEDTKEIESTTCLSLSNEESTEEDVPELSELEENIEKHAAKTNLTTKNVKSILHHLFSDKKLLEFAKEAANDISCRKKDSTDNDVEPRMTRSRWKKNKSSKQSAVQLSEPEFNEDDSEDEEYQPEDESFIACSDDESVSTTCSDQPSPLLLEGTESLQIKTEDFDQAVTNEYNNDSTLAADSTFVTHSDGTVFRMPGPPVSDAKTKMICENENEDEIIAKRTRSKVSMKDLSLETLEASFKPPDYDPALYDSQTVEEMDPDDLEWKNWLNKLIHNDELDESLDENDDDFNFMAAEESMDDEEFRTDKGAKITHKELQDLFDEVLNNFEDLLPDETSILNCVLPQLPVITIPQRLTIVAQLQQHTQLLAQTYLLTCNDPLLKEENENSKEYMNELVNFRNSMRNDLINDGTIYNYPGLDDAVKISDNFAQPQSFDYMIPQLEVMRNTKERDKKPRKSDFLIPMPVKCGLTMLTMPYFAAFPELLPKQGLLATEALDKVSNESQRLKFFKSEDNLLALGMSQFGNDFELISQYMLPVKTAKQLRTRAKNLCSKREYENPVRAFKRDQILPALTSKVSITQPRSMSSRSVKQMYPELSFEAQLPSWIEKMNADTKLIEGEFRKQATFNTAIVKFTANLRPIAVKDPPILQIPIPFIPTMNGRPMLSHMQPIQPAQSILQPTLQSTSKPVHHVTQAVHNISEPVQNLLQSVHNMLQPMQNTSEPVQSISEPGQNRLQPVQNISESVQNLLQSVHNMLQPVQNTSEPVQSTLKPGQNRLQPVHNISESVQNELEIGHGMATGTVERPNHAVKSKNSQTDISIDVSNEVVQSKYVKTELMEPNSSIESFPSTCEVSSNIVTKSDSICEALCDAGNVENILDDEQLSDAGGNWLPRTDVNNDDIIDDTSGDTKTVSHSDDVSCDDDVEEQDEDSIAEDIEVVVPDFAEDSNERTADDDTAEPPSSPADVIDCKEIDAEEEQAKVDRIGKQKKSTRSGNSRRRKDKPRNPKFNWEVKLQEKASKFADLYFEKVKEALADKVELYCDFLYLINDAEVHGYSKVKIYEKLSSLFKDYPDLIEMFVGFLEPDEAREIGRFKTWLQFYRARTFLLNCEANFVKTKYYHQLLRKIVKIDEADQDYQTIVDTFTPLFHGNKDLISEFTTFFRDFPPPKCRGEDFEIIEYRPETGGFEHVDEFEEVKLVVNECDSEEPMQRKKKTILDDLASWLQKPALTNSDGTSARLDKNEAKRTEQTLYQPKSVETAFEDCDGVDSLLCEESCLMKRDDNEDMFKDREDNVDGDEWGGKSTKEKHPSANESNCTPLKLRAATDRDLTQTNSKSCSDVTDDKPNAMLRSNIAINRTPRVVTSKRLSNTNLDTSPSGTRLNKFRLNVKRFEQKEGFHMIMGNASLDEDHEKQHIIPHMELFSSDEAEDYVGNETGDEDEAVSDITDDESSGEDNDVGDDDCLNDEDQDDVEEDEEMSASDIHYDDNGEIIFKWSREDDRLILTTCQQKGPSDTTFQCIADQLKRGTKIDVQQRFIKLMELYKTAKSK